LELEYYSLQYEDEVKLVARMALKRAFADTSSQSNTQMNNMYITDCAVNANILKIDKMTSERVGVAATH
jgi:hypothetical protein